MNMIMNLMTYIFFVHVSCRHSDWACKHPVKWVSKALFLIPTIYALSFSSAYTFVCNSGGILTDNVFLLIAYKNAYNRK